MTRRRVSELERFLRNRLPFGLGLVFVLLAVLPHGIPYLTGLAPLFPMIAVYYWSIYRPDLMPAWAAFTLGLCQDVLGGAPLGLNALILVLVHGVCLSQRKVFLSNALALGWSGFAVIAAGAAGFGWLVAMLFHASLLDPRPALLQALLTIVLYPPFDWLFGRTGRYLPEAG